MGTALSGKLFALVTQNTDGWATFSPILQYTFLVTALQSSIVSSVWAEALNCDQTPFLDPGSNKLQ